MRTASVLLVEDMSCVYRTGGVLSASRKPWEWKTAPRHVVQLVEGGRCLAFATVLKESDFGAT